MKIPQFKEKRFNSDEELNQWLDEISKYEITLRDFGQDMLKLWVHESGEILYSMFFSIIYFGKFLNTDALKEGEPIEIWEDDEQKYIKYQRLIAEEIATKEFINNKTTSALDKPNQK